MKKQTSKSPTADKFLVLCEYFNVQYMTFCATH